MNGLNALVLKHFFIIGIHLGTLCAKLLAGLLRTLFNYIAEAYNLNSVTERLERGQMLACSDTAAADNACFNLCHKFHLIKFFLL